jgi:phosphatidylglycerophosphatase A
VSDDTQTSAGESITPQIFKSPAQFLAFGFGSGLFPRMPGTMGTLAAIPLYLLLVQLGLPLYSFVLVLAILVGVWICGVASTQLKAHDHPGIVWDEFVGFWITMWAVPAEPVWIISGFLVFRFLDIVKPWPISSLDKSVMGGMGIMVDDMVAGVMACLTLHVAMAII